MSETNQIHFKSKVLECFEKNQAILNVSPPEFIEDGFITTAHMKGESGMVELRSGPGEYNVEVFIFMEDGQRKWGLVDMMKIKPVRDWLLSNRPSTQGKSTMQVEIEHAFRLLSESLGKTREFGWLVNT